MLSPSQKDLNRSFVSNELQSCKFAEKLRGLNFRPCMPSCMRNFQGLFWEYFGNIFKIPLFCKQELDIFRFKTKASSSQISKQRSICQLIGGRKVRIVLKLVSLIHQAPSCQVIEDPKSRPNDQPGSRAISAVHLGHPISSKFGNGNGEMFGTNHPATLTWVLRVLVIMLLLNIQLGNSKPKPKRGYLFANLYWGPTFVYREKQVGKTQVQKSPPCLDLLSKYISTYGYRFTMHGLWMHPKRMGEIDKKEDRKIGQNLSRIGESTGSPTGLRLSFDLKGVDYRRLEEYWPTFIANQQEDFWFHEWWKHGREIVLLQKLGLRTKRDYLVVSSMFAEYVDRIFKEYTPNLGVNKDSPTREAFTSLLQKYIGRTFERNDFVSDIESKIGVTINIQCYNQKIKVQTNGKTKEIIISLIESIEFCFDHIKSNNQGGYNFLFKNCIHQIEPPKRECLSQFLQLPIYYQLFPGPYPKPPPTTPATPPPSLEDL